MRMCVMTHSYVWHDSFVCVTRLTCVYMSLRAEWHASSTWRGLFHPQDKCVACWRVSYSGDYTAAHCNILQHTATRCNTLQYTATHCSILQHSAVYCNTLHFTATQGRFAICRRVPHSSEYTATHCNTLQHTAPHCNTTQHNAKQRNTLQHNATHCNTLKHTATHCNALQCIANLSPVGESLEPTTTHCNTQQRNVPHCNVLHTATCSNTLPHSHWNTLQLCFLFANPVCDINVRDFLWQR